VATATDGSGLRMCSLSTACTLTSPTAVDESTECLTALHRVDRFFIPQEEIGGGTGLEVLVVEEVNGHPVHLYHAFRGFFIYKVMQESTGGRADDVVDRYTYFVR